MAEDDKQPERQSQEQTQPDTPTQLDRIEALLRQLVAALGASGAGRGLGH